MPPLHFSVENPNPPISDPGNGASGKPFGCKSKGWKIMGERVRVGKRDELDIVAEQNGVLVFVEVKTRKNENFGRPVSAVNRAKRRNLSRAAVNYLKRQNPPPDYFRFDVIEVIGEPGMGPPGIRHIENAFPLDSAYRLWW